MVSRYNSMSKHSILILTLIDSIIASSLLIVVPVKMLDLFGNDLAQAALWTSLLISFSAGLNFVSTPLFATLSDRLGARPILIASMSSNVVGLILLLSASDLYSLIAGRLIIGALGSIVPIANSEVRNMQNRVDRQSFLARVSAIAALGTAAGPGVVGWLLMRPPPQLFIIALTIACVGMIVSFSLEHRTHAAGIEAKKIKRSLSIRTISQLSIRTKNATAVLFVIQLSTFSLFAIWPFYTEDALGWSSSTIGLSFSLYGVCAAISQLIASKISLFEKTPEYSLIYSTIAIAISFLILFLSESTACAFLGILLGATGTVAIPNIYHIVSQEYSNHVQGRVQAALAFITGIARFLSPLIFGFIFSVMVTSEKFDKAAIFLAPLPIILPMLIAQVKFANPRSVFKT